MASFPRIPRGKPSYSMPIVKAESSSFVGPSSVSFAGPPAVISAGSFAVPSAEPTAGASTGPSTSELSGPLVDTGSSEFINDPIKRLSQERYGKKENLDVAEQPEKDAEKEREKMRVLVSSFSEDQLNRYEMYRRAAFPKAAIKRLMQSVMGGSSVPPNVVIAMAGISKVFVGEVVEEALDFMEKTKQTGPIQPKHLREAVRKLKKKTSIPNIRYKKTLLN